MVDIKTNNKVQITIEISNPHPASVLTATRELAAAGGCTVLVRVIKIKTNASTRPNVKRLFPSILHIISAEAVESKCPPITWRGWDNGLLWAPNTSKQLAPRGPIVMGYPKQTAVKPVIIIAMRPPAAEIMESI